MYHLLLHPFPADYSKGYPAVKGPASKLGRLWKALYKAAKAPNPTWVWACDAPPPDEAPSLEKILSRIPAKSHCIIGHEELFRLILGRKGIDDWCGQPYEAHGRTWWPILDMYRIDQNPALFEPVCAFVHRAHAGVGTYKEPIIHYNPSVESVPDEVLALDIETEYDDAPLPYKKLRTIAVANSEESWVWDYIPTTLLNKGRRFVTHNGLFDFSALRGNGFSLGPVFADTMHMSNHLWPGMPADLGFLAAFLTEAPRWKAPAHKTMEELMRYNALDAAMTARLFSIMEGRMTDWFWNHTMPNVNIAIDICVQGVPIEMNALQNHRVKLGELVKSKTERIQGWAREAGYEGNINLSSPKQVGKLFCETLGARVLERTGTGQAAFGKTALTKYCTYGDVRVETMARELLVLRKYQKLKEAFIDCLPMRDGKVYPQFRPEGAVTGRWTCKEPNCQQIPKPNKDAQGNAVPGLRDLFAREGWWVVCCDFSQQELIAMALISGEKKMLEAAANGVDMHKLNASSLFKCSIDEITKQQRKLAKTAGLGCLYGAQAVTLRDQLAPEWPGITLTQCEQMRKNFFEECPDVALWHKKIVDQATLCGYITKDISRQRINFYSFVKPNECYNMPVQGMGADVLSLSLRRIAPKIGENIQWLALVHDEVALLAKDPLEAAELLVNGMVQTVTIEGRSAKFNVEVKIGKTWGSTKDFAIKPGWQDEVRSYVNGAL